MNKNLHRVIFNKARGIRMVVQETASSEGKASNGSTGSANISAFRIIVIIYFINISDPLNPVWQAFEVIKRLNNRHII